MSRAAHAARSAGTWWLKARPLLARLKKRHADPMLVKSGNVDRGLVSRPAWERARVAALAPDLPRVGDVGCGLDRLAADHALDGRIPRPGGAHGCFPLSMSTMPGARPSTPSTSTASLPHADQPGRAGPRRFSSIFGSVGKNASISSNGFSGLAEW